MIYLFTGNNQTLITSEVQKWKQRFIEKFGDFNLTHIRDTVSLEKNLIHEILLSSSFLGGKKFILIEGISSSAKEKNLSEDDSTPTGGEIEQYIYSIIESIPVDNIVVFVSTSPDKRSILYKKIVEIGEIKDFSVVEDEQSIVQFLSQRYSQLGQREISQIVRLKSNHLEKSIQEIEKILTFSSNPTSSDIDKYITPELEETIFRCVDVLIEGDTIKIQKVWQIIQEQTNFYYFYNSLLGNIRNFVYISLLKENGLSPNAIDDILKLGNRKFLIQKRYTLSSPALKQLNLKLIQFDKKIKSGYTLGSTDSELFSELLSDILPIIHK